MALTKKETNQRRHQLKRKKEGKSYIPQPVLKVGRPAAVYDAQWIAAVEKYLDKKPPSFKPSDDVRTPFAAPVVMMDAETFDELTNRPWYGISFGRVC